MSRRIETELIQNFQAGRIIDMSLFYTLKRGWDILVCLLALVLIWPILAVIAIAIRIESKGPAIFKQQRAGKDGQPFTFYKFRTMHVDADPFGPSPKSGQDPRLTRTGRILREYSLDELPQLFNILRGDMSVVGPRPLYLSQMPEWSEQQKKRLLVKPGLTGLAQISGRAELTREEKLDLDVKYVETAGFSTDMKILWATITHVLKKKGVYEKRYSQDQYTRGVKQ